MSNEFRPPWMDSVDQMLDEGGVEQFLTPANGGPPWPAHLRDDAPSQRCGRCGRSTWSTEDFGTEDRMTQPDGYPCGGRFQ